MERIIETTDSTFVSTSINRTLDPPWGLAGGEPGRPGNIQLKLPRQEAWQDIKRMSMLELPKGSIVRIRTSGGGGWGSPEERSNAAIDADILAGLVDKGGSR